MHLHRKFPGGDENEPHRHATDGARLAREKALDHRQTKCGGLAGAGLRTRQKIDSAQHEGAEVIEDRYDGLKALLLRRLTEQAERARSAVRERPPHAYLICDRRDRHAVEEMEDFFFERGVEVSLPLFDASEDEALESHLENLRQCDAALVYYGAAGPRWVDSHLRELAKASGYRATGPIPVQVVYLAPPFDHGKESFKRLSVEVLRQGAQLNPRLLDSLVVRILETRSDG